MDESRSTEWYAFAGLAISAFAILEHRAIRSDRKLPTLSAVVATRTRTSKTRAHVSTAVIMGAAAWASFHFNYEPRGADGTFASYTLITAKFKGVK